jgi:HAD superfamily hydrolase (TIGR01484 family)
MKKILAFDLDDTLSMTKTPLDPQMVSILGEILTQYEICVISGASYEQMLRQVVVPLKSIGEEKLAKVHLMPTCGTRYYRFKDQEWQLQYANDLSPQQKRQITTALEHAARSLGYWLAQPAGEIIEDRQSQITYSALGQQASAEDKYAWDPTNEKKYAIRDLAAKSLPGLEVRAGGTTSIDVTLPGIDKAYGMQQLITHTGVTVDEVLFFGDKLEEGGNDYPVKEYGIDTEAVEGWEDTARHLQQLLAKNA